MKNWLRVLAALIGMLLFLGILALVLAGAGMVSPWFYVIGSLSLAVAGFLGARPEWPKDDLGGDTVG